MSLLRIVSFAAATPALASPTPPVELLRQSFCQRFDLREAGPVERPVLQAFIQRCFHASHGAHIEHFMPRLLGLYNRTGDLVAAFGMRTADQGPLFLENYLDVPIETMLRARFGPRIRREDIVEVGNLSATHAGATRWLILAITLMLHQQRHRWITFTATGVVRNALLRLGLQPVELGAAALSRLPAHEQAHWGNYYQQAPVVMTGDMEYGFRALTANESLMRLLGASAEGVAA
jgi:hypothetical protein